MLVTCWNCEAMVVIEPGEYRCPDCNAAIQREERNLPPLWAGTIEGHEEYIEP